MGPTAQGHTWAHLGPTALGLAHVNRYMYIVSCAILCTSIVPINGLPTSSLPLPENPRRAFLCPTMVAALGGCVLLHSQSKSTVDTLPRTVTDETTQVVVSPKHHQELRPLPTLLPAAAQLPPAAAVSTTPVTTPVWPSPVLPSRATVHKVNCPSIVRFVYRVCGVSRLGANFSHILHMLVADFFFCVAIDICVL